MKLKITLLLLLAAVALEGANKAEKRCYEAARLLDEIMATPEQAIPRRLLDRAHCIALIPGVKKVGFVFGGRFGKGVLLCRDQQAPEWKGPSAIRVEGGSFGLQIGGSSTDIVLLVMNQEGVEKILASKFTLGADAAVAGGPVGRTVQAQTDARMHAKILSYSRSRGVFAGVSLEGATLRPDEGANKLLYGEAVSHREILTGEVQPSAVSDVLPQTLAKYSVSLEDSDVLAEDAAEPEPPDREQRGVIRIASKPEMAEVEINGNFNGLTPRGKVVQPGEYEIILAKQGFESWVRTVTVEPGETVELQAELVLAEPPGESELRSGMASPGQGGSSGVRISGLR